MNDIAAGIAFGVVARDWAGGAGARWRRTGQTVVKQRQELMKTPGQATGRGQGLSRRQGRSRGGAGRRRRTRQTTTENIPGVFPQGDRHGGVSPANPAPSRRSGRNGTSSWHRSRGAADDARPWRSTPRLKAATRRRSPPRSRRWARTAAAAASAVPREDLSRVRRYALRLASLHRARRLVLAGAALAAPTRTASRARRSTSPTPPNAAAATPTAEHGGKPYAGGRALATPFGTFDSPEHHARPRDRHRPLERGAISCGRCAEACAPDKPLFAGLPVPLLQPA